MSTLRYHLTGFEFSGRAIRVRRLLPTEIQEHGAKAARLVGPTMKDAPPETLGMSMRAAEIEEGIAAMVIAYSQPVTPGDYAEATAAGAPPDSVAKLQWTTIQPNAIMAGDVDLDKLFTSKDIALIARIYTRLHEASKEEADAIMGKAVEET